MDCFSWKILLNSNIERVYNALTTDLGRESFWCEKSIEKDRVIEYNFINGEKYYSKIVKSIKNKQFSIEYFNSIVSFNLKEDSDGVVLELVNKNINESEFLDNYAGWISVLLNLKSVLEFGNDLRNHNPNKTWNEKFVDN